VAGDDVGAYAIQQGDLAASSNYELSFTGADLTVTAKPITATADVKSKVYGQDDPELTYTVPAEALVGTDELTGGLSRVAGDDVGAYAIQQGDLAASSNYELSFTGADLTVTAKPITVTADAKTKTVGDGDPALTYGVATGSLVGQDRLEGELTRVAGETAGTYAINRGTLDAGSNYSVTYIGADLTIAPMQVKALWTYGVGFKSPVSMDSRKVNQLKGGSTVPLKFNVYKDGLEQRDLSAIKGSKVVKTGCDSTDLSNAVDAVSTGSSSLRYDTAEQQFVFNWKAPTGVACYRIGVVLADDTEFSTDFKVTK
jgi:hypothetical protein